MFGIISEIWNFLLIVSPWLLLGLFIAGLIHSFIGESFIKEHLGGSGFIPVLKATLFGIPLPVCSVPIAAALLMKGLIPGAALAFKAVDWIDLTLSGLVRFFFPHLPGLERRIEIRQSRRDLT